MIKRTLSWGGVSADGKPRWVTAKASDIIAVEDSPVDKTVTVMLSHGRAMTVFTESAEAAVEAEGLRGWPEGTHPTAPEVSIALSEWLWGWPFCHCWAERCVSIHQLIVAIGKKRQANLDRAREAAAAKRMRSAVTASEVNK